jgi:hypothetical protein
VSGTPWIKIALITIPFSVRVTQSEVHNALEESCHLNELAIGSTTGVACPFGESGTLAVVHDPVAKALLVMVKKLLIVKAASRKLRLRLLHVIGQFCNPVRFLSGVAIDTLLVHTVLQEARSLVCRNTRPCSEVVVPRRQITLI